MNPSQLPPHAQVMSMASSKWISKPLWVAARLGIADLLAEGPKTIEELARKTSTHEPSVYRILRALASVGIFTEVGPRRFSLTPLAETLKSDHPQSTRDIVIFINHPVHDKAWTEILYSVETGKPAFERALGMPIFEYFKKDKEFSEVFNRAMTGLARNDVAAVVDSYDFSGIGKLMDVGGGHGALMTAILKRNPSIKGVVFDVEHVIAGTRKSLQESGLHTRCEAIGGDFFKSIPYADVIVLSHIIHDWDDERSVAILQNCRKALPSPQGKVLICETVIPPGDQPSPSKLLDIEMMVMPGGVERTSEEYEELLKRAGFKLSRIVGTKGAMSVVEGVVV